ncbi:Ribosomal RNA large subunit methyltransferase E [Chromobacterium violaceum]|uniref:Ribosomal RNA large subunit methyltransferase E n=1 Tax=Chromobacterium violaceum TaxID=536 RepID=A0A3S4LLC5_CHRVL|nr:Ribosomal RNA large subunit methyltransferase E [Chromobacterium violaceum]
MARSKSSNNWLQEHVNDQYVHMAQKDGYRARAAYKLLEINDKDKLIRPGTVLADLGSTPGSWSQVAARIVGEKGKVFALDILDMDPVPAWISSRATSARKRCCANSSNYWTDARSTL